MNKEIVAVILAGGVGSRLWPLSTPNFPKQFLTPIKHQYSYFQQALKRAKSVTDKIIIVGNVNCRDIMLAQTKQLNIEPYYILENIGKNTSSSIITAAFYVNQHYGKNSKIWVIPSDQIIDDSDLLGALIIKANQSLGNDKILVFGVNITEISEQFGYIIADCKSGGFYKVTEFIEKPSLAQILTYINFNCFINSGMVLANSDAILDKAKLLDALYFNQLRQSYLDIISEDHIAHITYPSDLIHIAFDKFMLEKLNDLLCLPLAVNWVDIGNWHNMFKAYGCDSVSFDNHPLAANINNLDLNELPFNIHSEDGVITIAEKNPHASFQKLTSS